MVRVLSVILALLLSAHSARAFDWTWGGTLRLDTAYQTANKTSLLNPDGQLFDVGRWVGQGLVDLQLGVAPYPALDFTLKNRAIGTITEDGNRVDNFLEDAYLVYRLSPQFLLELGKEKVREGVGYAWNPVDFFRTRSAAGLSQDPKEQRDHRQGHYLVRGEARWGSRGLAIVYAPEFQGLDTEEASNIVDQFWIRGTDLLAGTDVALYLYKGREWNSGVSLARVFGNALELHLEAVVRRVRSRELPTFVALGGPAGTIPIPLWKERRMDRLVGKTLVGGQYTFPNGLNLIAEYFYNGDGLTPGEWATLFDGLELSRRSLERSGSLGPGGPNLSRVFALRANQLLTPAESGQHYVFFRASGSLPLDRELALAGFYLLNLQDGSGTLSGEARYRIWRGLEGVLTFDLFYGPQRTEFGNLPVRSSVRVSLRYAF